MNLIYIFGSVLIVSLASFSGVTILALGEAKIRKYINLFISFAAGALISDVFLHVLPELAEGGHFGQLGFGMLVGILIFFVLERLIHVHHSHRGGDMTESASLTSRYIILLGDGLHNFMDGLAIAAAFQVDMTVGIATAIAVLLHELPHEIGDFAVLLHSGYTAKKALLANFISALTAFLGAGLGIWLGEFGGSTWILALAASSFLYIALSDLLPSLHGKNHKDGQWKDIVMIILGSVCVGLLLFLE